MPVLRNVALSLALTLACAAGAQAKGPPLLGDYDNEPRAGSHVDSDLLAQRLRDLGANTYMWLVWHSANDWDDLKLFLPKAERAGITVWVYLVPHSETPADDPRTYYSEPYRLDYVRWAEEIARLSLQRPNLTGYVIDDFWSNVRPGRFTPDYIRRMTAAGKAINPKLKFYPLMYFNEIGVNSVDILAPLVDGVVAAYPPDRAAVEHALEYLEDRWRLPAAVEIAFPWDTPSKPGQHAFVVQEARVVESKDARLSFRYRHDYQGPTKGYHRLQVRVDDKVVWDEEVVGHEDGVATVDLSKAVGGRQNVELSVGIFDVKGVSTFGIQAWFEGLTVRGLELKDANLAHEAAWRKDVAGVFSVKFMPERAGAGRYRLPMIVMPAATTTEYKARYKEEGTPEHIAGRVRMLAELARDGRIEGIVTYCLDKSARSATFEAVRKIYEPLRK
jgi:hypothetical protein